MSEPQPAAPKPPGRILGWALVVAGGLWTLLTGGCTLALITAMSGEFGRSSGGMGVLGTYLLIGAVCTAPGAGLLIVGLSLLRPRKHAP